MDDMMQEVKNQLTQEEGPCDFSFPCAWYRDKCLATYASLQAEVKELVLAAEGLLVWLTAITGYSEHKFTQTQATARLIEAVKTSKKEKI
jgi:hypothetical protein